jgi:hypothetical protein
MAKSNRRFTVWMWLLLVASAVSFTVVPASAQNRRDGGGYGGGITVYVNPNFTGESATFRNDTPDLRAFGLNDKISSIQIPNGESWEVCQDINYANRCQMVSGSISDLRSMGWNDKISSLRRVRGFQGQQGGVYTPNYPGNYPGYSQGQGLVIYDRAGFRGASRTVTAQTSNLGNRAGSVQVQGGGAWELCDRTGRCATVSQNVSDLSQLGLNGQITSVRPVNDQRYNNGNGRGWGRGRQNRY